MIHSEQTTTIAKELTAIVITILLLVLPTSLMADEWKLVRIIPDGTVPVYTYVGGLNVAGFTDQNHGIAISVPGDVHYTVDGGTTWTYAPVPEISYLNSIEIFDAKYAWVGSGLDTRYTTDGGKTWNILPAYGSIYSSGHFLSFIDPLRGWYGISRGGTVATLAKTSDGGKNWTPVDVPSEARDTLGAISLVSDTTGFLLLNNGKVFRTDNGGKKWIVITSLPLRTRTLNDTVYGGLTKSALRFSDRMNGTAVIFTMKPYEYCSFTTHDGGRSWAVDSLPAEIRSFHGSVFLSRDNRYLTITDLENGSLIVCVRK
jgi:photosystem II stability/assembly factor-like uncharacterized protein